jgi:beta-xylosidase
MKILAALTLLATATLASAEATAPLLLPDMPLHDPYIVAHAPSHTYYLYTSNVPRMSGTEGRGTMVYKSKDLKHWEKPQSVFSVPQDSFAKEGAWAPEVHEYKGRWYLFTTLHNTEKTIAEPPDAWQRTYVRGTITAVSDSPEGPFKMLNPQGAVTRPDFMTLDGTLFIDPEGKPWMVYAHEWLQKIDGTMEAVPLKPDLSAAAGDPIHLFKASDAPWLNAALSKSPANTQPLNYTTDGPQLYRTHQGRLLMLWSSYENGSYVETIARSKTDQLAGPWEQLDPLIKQDSGHGMLFHTFEGTLMMVLHRPFKNARGKLYEMADRGDHLEVVKQRTDLDGGDPESIPKASEEE